MKNYPNQEKKQIHIEKSMAQAVYLLKVNSGNESKVLRVVK